LKKAETDQKNEEKGPKILGIPSKILGNPSKIFE